MKIEPNGAAGSYLREHVRVGDALDVSSPRGSFIPQPGERPVVLLSAGIGATPVLAMLHALAAVRSTRQVLWLYAAPDRKHHPFAAEVRRLMLALAHGRMTTQIVRRPWRQQITDSLDGGFAMQMFAHLAKNTAAHGRSHIGDAVAYVRKGKRNNFD